MAIWKPPDKKNDKTTIWRPSQQKNKKTATATMDGMGALRQAEANMPEFGSGTIGSRNANISDTARDLGAAAKAGSYNTLARTAFEKIVPNNNAGGILEQQAQAAKNYQPQTIPEKLAYGAGSILTDAPIYLVGGEIIGAPVAAGVTRALPTAGRALPALQAGRLATGPVLTETGANVLGRTVGGYATGAAMGGARGAMEGENPLLSANKEGMMWAGAELGLAGIAPLVKRAATSPDLSRIRNLDLTSNRPHGNLTNAEKKTFETGMDIGENIQPPKNRPLSPGISPASLRLPSTIETITSKTDKESILKRLALSNIAQKIQSAYYKTVDGRNRLNDVDKLYAKSTGRNLSANEQTFILAHNSSNAETTAEHVLTRGLVDSRGNIVGVPLMEIVKKVPKGEWRKFEDYLKLNHFKSWEAQGMEVYPKELNMNEILAARKVAEYDRTHPWMAQAAQDYTNWIKDFGEKWAVDTGMVSRAQWQAMRQQYQDYIPMQRLLDEVEIGVTSATGTKSSFVDQPSPIKTARGSERKTIESLETLIERVPSYIKAAKRNEVAQKLIDMMRRDPDGMKAFGELVDPKTTNLSMSNIVAARVNGERVNMRINDLPLLEALTNLSTPAQNIVVEGARSITSKMKLLTTGINPIFSLGRNIVRDLPMSYVASKSTNNPATWARDIVGSLIDIVGNRAVAKSYRAMGGGHATAVSADVNLLRTTKAKLTPGYYNLSNIKNPVEYARRILNVPFTWLERIADVTETLPRLGEYRRILRQEGDTYATRSKALFESKDITVNFSKTKTAEISSFLDAFVPYFGAAIQGLDKFGRTYKDKPFAAITKTFAAVTVPTLALYTMNHDNPNYQKLSNWVKDTNFCIPLPNGTFLKLPKPREGGVIFGALVERTLRQFKEHDPDAFYKFADSVKVSFVPPNPLRDNIASPIITDIPANKDFANRPIVPGYMENMSPEQQYDEKTSKISKAVGQKFNVSPKQIDYIASSYLGIIGQVGIPVTSEGSFKDAVARMFTADPAYSQDVTQKFYEQKKELDTMRADTKQTGSALETQDERMRKLYGKVADLIGDNRIAMREIEKSGMDAAEKKAKLREMQLKTVALASIVEQPVEAQMKIYDELKRKGFVVEEKPKSQLKLNTEKKNQLKRSDKASGIILR